ncbi:MAG: hypothetical protein JXA87_02395 [Thermoleophilia bacterium]|nr:hypothetical protein [Thermoleophilia bacterium]
MAVDEQVAKQPDLWQPAAAQSDAGRLAAARSTSKPRRKTNWSLLAATVVGLAIVAAAVAIPLTRDDPVPEKQQAGGIPAALQAQIEEMTGEETVYTREDVAKDAGGEAANRSHDAMARILIENAMDSMKEIMARLDYSGEIPTTEYSSRIREALQTMGNKTIRWEWGTRGVYKEPHGSSQAEENTVSWTYIPPSAYELGTWSASGTAIGVRVDDDAGTIIFYRDGTEGY